MSYTPGPKVAAIRALRENRDAARVSAEDLRAKIEAVKNKPPKPKKAPKRKRPR